MNDDNLWDRSGPPDPEIQRLEEMLAPFRYQIRRLEDKGPRPFRAWRLAAAAAVVLAIAAGVLWRAKAPAPEATPWSVEGIEGQARFGSRPAAMAMTVPGGQAVRTGPDGRLTLVAEDTGRVDLGPDSILHASSGRKLALERGGLHAYIWARPGQFVVDTPSARAIDLGCEYTLTVDARGDGRLRVSLGWVAFQYAGHESFIPAGAECATHVHGGPGVPFFEGASEGLRRAVARFDANDPGAMAEILADARERDGLTVWHLLTRVAARDRGVVFDRFATLVKLPAEVRREAAVRGDARAIDQCWNALGLEDTDWWRGWERKW